MTFRICTIVAILILALVFTAIVAGILPPIWLLGTLACVVFGIIFVGRIEGANS